MGNLRLGSERPNPAGARRCQTVSRPWRTFRTNSFRRATFLRPTPTPCRGIALIYADGPFHAFVLTFPGYQALGDDWVAIAIDARERWQTCGELPATLTELRGLLFVEQRAYHWTAGDFDEQRPFATAYIRALVDAIRAILSKDDVRRA